MTADARYRLSIVVPARDEAGNLARLVAEVRGGVRDAGVDAELVVVDDGSTDGTWPTLDRLAAEHPWLRPVRLTEGRGQTIALGVGIARARAPFVATLDADLQNDPADLPAMLRLLVAEGVDLVQGHRADRRDPWAKRQTGRVGRAARRLVLHDRVRDTGCSTRVATADLARRWPLHLRGMHRFIPAVSAMLGARLLEVPVHHRPRTVGNSHYGSLRRGAVGLVDLLAVRWMMSRYRPVPPVLTPDDPRNGCPNRHPLNRWDGRPARLSPPAEPPPAPADTSLPCGTPVPPPRPVPLPTRPAVHPPQPAQP